MEDYMENRVGTLRALALAGGIGLVILGAVHCARNRPDFVGFIHGKDAAYRAGPAIRTGTEVRAKRRALQAALLEEFSANPEAFVKRIPKEERHFLFDAVVDGQAMMRVGRPADGGKWVCNPQFLGDRSIVYSFGVGEDISFDTDMAGLFGSQVYLFDPNPEVAGGFPERESGYLCGTGRLFYRAVGLGPVSTEKGREWDLVIKGRACEAKSLLDISRSLGHARVDIVKIDIEGGEYASLSEILSSRALTELDVKMVLVEFHFWDDGRFADFIRLVAALAQEDFWLYRKEFNPANIKCAEYAFVRSSFLDPRPGREPGLSERP
jgi:Methyltransferase domain